MEKCPRVRMLRMWATCCGPQSLRAVSSGRRGVTSGGSVNPNWGWLVLHSSLECTSACQRTWDATS